MKHLSRRQLLASIGATYATIGLTRFPAGAAEFNYKWGHFGPATHPLTIRSKEAAEKIGQDSGGRIDLKVFPAYQLGNDQSMVTQTRAGAMEMVTIADGQFAQAVPVVAITLTPFAFDGYKQAWSAVDGALGSYVRGIVRKDNLFPFEKEWDIGMRQLSNQLRPILKPDDMKGLKVLVTQNPLDIALFKAFGASPTPMGGEQLYVSLQTHLADALGATLSSLEFVKFYEVLKYVAMTNHAWVGMTTVANNDAMLRLPKNLRDIVERRHDEAALLERNDIFKLDESLVPTLKGHGLTFTQPDVTAFKGATRAGGIYAQLRDQYGAAAWAALEKSRGKLA